MPWRIRATIDIVTDEVTSLETANAMIAELVNSAEYGIEAYPLCDDPNCEFKSDGTCYICGYEWCSNHLKEAPDVDKYAPQMMCPNCRATVMAKAGNNEQKLNWCIEQLTGSPMLEEIRNIIRQRAEADEGASYTVSTDWLRTELDFYAVHIDFDIASYIKELDEIGSVDCTIHYMFDEKLGEVHSLSYSYTCYHEYAIYDHTQYPEDHSWTG